MIAEIPKRKFEPQPKPRAEAEKIPPALIHLEQDLKYLLPWTIDSGAEGEKKSKTDKNKETEEFYFG